MVGHGLHAAATMGRLRTAVLNFSTLDLPPDELLGHLAELVTHIDQHATTAEDEPAIAGATCLYAVYDPTGGTRTLTTSAIAPQVSSSGTSGSTRPHSGVRPGSHAACRAPPGPPRRAATRRDGQTAAATR
ncbi:hypothetical protein P3T39_004382 [Kitasatospora sp. GP82]|nr:hypothetical protein [Kitasatospora sp. GP82]